MTEVSHSSPGIEQASVLLLTLGEDVAAEVVRYFTSYEAEKIGRAMVQHDSPNRSRVQQVAQAFLDDTELHTAFGMDTRAYVSALFSRVLGQEKASVFIDRLMPGEKGKGEKGKGLEMLQWMEAGTVAELIGSEHPQVLAVVLSSLDSDHSAQVLACLPTARQADVLTRIARLERVPRVAIEEINAHLEQQWDCSVALGSAKLGGLDQAVAILSEVDESAGGAIIDHVQQADEALGQKLQELQSGMDCVLQLSDPEIKILLKTVPHEVLCVALLGTENDVQEKIIANLSKRKAESLIVRQQGLGMVKPREVEQAQGQLLLVARQLQNPHKNESNPTKDNCSRN